MVEAELHVGLHGAVEGVHLGQGDDLLGRNAADLGRALNGPVLQVVEDHVVLGLDRDALDLGHAAQAGPDGLGVGHGRVGLLVPHHIGVHGNGLAHGVGGGLGGLHAQVAHAEELPVGLDEERGLGVVAQELGVLPVVVDHGAAHTQGQRAVGAGVHGHEVVGLLRHGAVGDVDHGQVSAGVSVVEHEVGQLLL